MHLYKGYVYVNQILSENVGIAVNGQVKIHRQ